ncbi:MAG: YitT family protein [Phascolarctobacterium sp.]|nr:YitT family protein [Phascolarctobacterium sp.]
MNKFTNTIFYRYAMVAIACVVMGIAFNVFYVPNKLLSGGISGIAGILYYTMDLPIGIVSIILNIPLFILGYKFMDKEYLIGALYGMFVFSFALDFFSFLAELKPVHDTMLSCIAGGVMYGIGAALMYRVGGSGGGTDIIGAIVQKHYSISISTTGFIFNIGLLFVSSFLFGLEPALYTLLTMFVMTKTCNAFVIGFDFKKNIIIISDNPEPIAEAIIKIVGRGVTYLHGEGAFTHRQRDVLFVVAKLTQTAKIRSIVKDIDPNAFMIIHDVNDVFGRGFTLKASGPNFPRPLPPKDHHHEN